MVASLEQLFAEYQSATSALDTNDASVDNYRIKGEALLKIAHHALLEAVDTFRQGLKREPDHPVLKSRLDEALHKGKGSKVDTIMEKMDTGLARCMQLVREIRSTTSHRAIDVAPSALPPAAMPVMGLIPLLTILFILF
jgi:hypothetical protein